MGCMQSRRRSENHLHEHSPAEDIEHPEHLHKRPPTVDTDYYPESRYPELRLSAEHQRADHRQAERRHADHRHEEPMEEIADEIRHIEQRLHHLARPDRFRQGYRPSFYSAYARAARRYHFEAGKYGGFAYRNNVVVKIKGFNDRGTHHEVPAEAIQNGAMEYVVPVKVGSPGVTLSLDFDTGSSDLWVWSSEIAGAAQYRAQHRLYHPHRSITAHHTEGNWKISYGDGSFASGDVYTDTVEVAGVKIHNQAVEVAHSLSSSFLSDGGNDGLLGLAWPKLNTVQPHRVTTPVENMINNKLIDPPVFTVKLGHGSEQSFYSFGFIDQTVTHHPIVYHHVDNSQGFWQVGSTAWMLNGHAHHRSSKNTAILDTGTTLCLVHDDVVEAIYHSIGGAKYSNSRSGWIFPNHARLPEVSFAVGHSMYRLHEKDFGYSDAGDGYTFGGIQSRGDLSYDIFGDVFLKSVYVVFNPSDKTVGVGQRDD